MADWCITRSEEYSLGIAWITASESYNEKRDFERNLVEQLEPFFVKSAPSHYSTEKKGRADTDDQLRDDKNILRFFSSHIPIKKDVVLVIDNYNRITSQQIHSLMDKIVDLMPVNVHIALISNTLPPLSVVLRQVTGRALVITREELLMSSEEIDMFLKTQASYTCSSQELRRIKEITNGWVIALQLIALELKKGIAVSEALERILSGRCATVNSFIEDSLRSLSNNEKAFILNTSLLGGFNSGLADYALSRHGSDKLISKSLEKTYLLMADQDNKTFSYHLIFVAYLTQLAVKTSPEKSKIVFDRAVQWYLKSDDINGAIQTLIRSKDWNFC